MEKKKQLKSAQIKTKYGETKKIIVVYVPPKTKKFTKELNTKIIENTRELRNYY